MEMVLIAVGHRILHSQGLGEVGWGQKSGEGKCGVNTKIGIKRDDQGKQRDFCLCYVEGAELKLKDHYSVSQQQSPCITSNNRK